MALLVASAPAAAAPKRISGTLSKSAYTVIALADNGKASSVRVRGRRFRLRPPAQRVTLQLRARNGRYAGPIVIARARKGKVAILGVKAGARLGRIKVGRGYAKVANKPRRKWLDTKRVARAKEGVPIGARRFGRVRAKPPRRAPRDDRDLDGIPNPLDVDDDGDLILDDADTSRAGSARAAQGEAFRSTCCLAVLSSLTLELFRTVNANLGLTDAQIDAALPGFGVLTLTSGVDGDPGTPAEVDCGAPGKGLVYCRQGGSGQKIPLGSWAVTGEPFPGLPGGQFDPDGDGFGSLDVTPGPQWDTVRLHHGASAAQLGTGDLPVERATQFGAPIASTGLVAYVYNTTPALVSYSDEAGHSATPTYPAAPDAPGNRGNGFLLADGPDPDNDIELTVTFWRPQRKPIPGETGSWIDLGHQMYNAIPSPASQPAGAEGALPRPAGVLCPPSVYADVSPELTWTDRSGQFGFAGWEDSASDRPANRANTLTFKLNLSQCPHIAPTLATGQDLAITLSAIPANASVLTSAAGTVFYIRRP